MHSRSRSTWHTVGVPRALLWVPTRAPRSLGARGKVAFASENTNGRAVFWGQQNPEVPEGHLRPAYRVWGKRALCQLWKEEGAGALGMCPLATASERVCVCVYRMSSWQPSVREAGKPDNEHHPVDLSPSLGGKPQGIPFIRAASLRGRSERSGATTTNTECHTSKDTCQMPFPYKHPHHDLC